MTFQEACEWLTNIIVGEKKKLKLNEKEKLNVQLEKEGSKMDFEEVLLSVLEDFKDINLHSESGRVYWLKR